MVDDLFRIDLVKVDLTGRARNQNIRNIVLKLLKRRIKSVALNLAIARTPKRFYFVV